MIMRNSQNYFSKETIQNSFEGQKMIEVVEDITTPVYKESTQEALVLQSAATRTDYKKLENVQSDLSQYKFIEGSNKSNLRDILNEQEALILEGCLSA